MEKSGRVSQLFLILYDVGDQLALKNLGECGGIGNFFNF